MTPQARLATREFFGIKLGLATMRALCAALDDPQRSFLPVIVAGTNGKGSVTAMAASALRAATCANASPSTRSTRAMRRWTGP
jgi:folylpolyglutamate synthase/dihydropteroate synthase